MEYVYAIMKIGDNTLLLGTVYTTQEAAQVAASRNYKLQYFRIERLTVSDPATV